MKWTEGNMALLIDALGGQEKAEAALRKVIVAKCLDALRQEGATLGSVAVIADEEGWNEEFRSMTLADLVDPDPVDVPEGKKGPRMTRAEAKELRGEILNFLKDHPVSRVKEIVAGIGTRDHVGAQLNALVKRGLVVAEGTRGSMTYSWPAA